MTIIGYVPRLTINSKGIITHAEEVAIEGGAINWLGPWTAGTYQEDDLVEHNGSSWIATATTSDEPGVGSPNGWDLVAAKGDDGATGADGPAGMGVWRGAWTGSGYDALDIVEHNGSTWITTVPTADEPGVGSPNDWELVAAKGDTGATGPAGSVDSVTDVGTGAIVTVDNTDPANPIVGFAGVVVDGTTIDGDGTAGNPLTVIGGGGSDWDFTIEKSADEDIASTTLQDDDELLFAVTNGSTWLIELIAVYGGNGTGVDAKFNATFPQANGVYRQLSITSGDGASGGQVRVSAATTITTLVCGTRSTIDAYEIMRMELQLTFFGDGDFQVQFAANAAGTARMAAGSLLRARQLV